jgi:chemotaxis protein histidine kinase CheA
MKKKKKVVKKAVKKTRARVKPKPVKKTKPKAAVTTRPPDNDPPADIMAAINADPGVKIPEDRLEAVRAAVNEVIFAKSRQQELEERLSEVKQNIQDLTKLRLPELMDLAGTPKTTLAAKGNLPAMTVEVKPGFSANIAAAWEDDRKEAAYNWLEKSGNGTIIKTEIVVVFDKTDHKKALTLVRELRKRKMPVVIRNSVHAQTLTAWLKDQVTRVKKMPPLEVIGGHVYREAKIKIEDAP